MDTNKGRDILILD